MGDVVVITGASSGIGRAAAHGFAARGYDVVLAARDQSTLEDAGRECKERGSRSVTTVPTDVSDPSQVENLMGRALEGRDGVDVWVNNASVMAYGRFEDLSEDVYRQVIETNLFGTIKGSRVAMQHFRERGRGHLINVGSLYGRMTSPLVGPYVVAKFGVQGFTEVLHQEAIDEEGVHVSLVLPGSMSTPIFRHAANYTGWKTRPVPPISNVRRAADAVVGLVDRPRFQVIVGRSHHLFSWGRILFPALYDQLAPPVMRAAGLQEESEPDNPGNVFVPRPEWNRVYGEWSRSADLAALGRGAAAVTSRMATLVQRLGGRDA